MKIDIKIELDKDSQELIQTTLNRFAKNISGLVNIFETLHVKTQDVAVKTEVTTEPVPAENKTEPPIDNAIKIDIQPEADKPEIQKVESKKAESRKSKPKKNESQKSKSQQSESTKTGKSTPPKSTDISKKNGTSLEIVLNTIKKSGGINVDDLKKETKFGAKKVADAVYRLRKNGQIAKTDEGLYVVIG